MEMEPEDRKRHSKCASHPQPLSYRRRMQHKLNNCIQDIPYVERFQPGDNGDDGVIARGNCINPAELPSSMELTRNQSSDNPMLSQGCRISRQYLRHTTISPEIPFLTTNHLQPQHHHHHRFKEKSERRVCYLSRNHVILTLLPNFKTIAVLLLQVALLTVTSSVVVPLCQASTTTEASTVALGSTETQFTNSIGSAVSHRVSAVQNYWKDAVVPSSGYGKGYSTAIRDPNASHLSDSNNNVGGNSRRDSTPPPEGIQRQTTKRAAIVGIPIVRVHSTGFISLVDETSSGGMGAAAGALVGEDRMLLTPQLVGGEDSSRLLKVGPCLCWNTTDDGQKREVECKCTGQEMINVASSLPSDIHRLNANPPCATVGRMTRR